MNDVTERGAPCQLEAVFDRGPVHDFDHKYMSFFFFFSLPSAKVRHTSQETDIMSPLLEKKSNEKKSCTFRLQKNRQMQGQDVFWNFSEEAGGGVVVLVIGDQCHRIS